MHLLTITVIHSSQIIQFLWNLIKNSHFIEGSQAILNLPPKFFCGSQTEIQKKSSSSSSSSQTLIPMSSSSRINGLLKFERPVLVNEALSNTTKKSSSIKKNGNGIQPLSADAEATPSQTEEILATILPPRKWEDKMGKLWTQTVSSSPATRIEVIKLQQELGSSFPVHFFLSFFVLNFAQSFFFQIN